MILSYTLPGAEENIMAGVKIHTIRGDKVDRWKGGREIHHVTGNRTKNYNNFLINKCYSTQQILLVLLTNKEGERTMKVTVDRSRLSPERIETLAINDGFVDVQEMIDWFFKEEGRTMWAGKIIHWTRLKY